MILFKLVFQYNLFLIGENIIAKTVSAKLQAAIKAKASFEEVVEVLKEIPDEDTELHTNPLRV